MVLLARRKLQVLLWDYEDKTKQVIPSKSLDCIARSGTELGKNTWTVTCRDKQDTQIQT